MKCEFSPYTLEYNPDFHAIQKQSKRYGALLKVTFLDGLIGYADCHPWPELGDQPLLEQLKALKEKKTTSLLTCSLNFARLDAEARSQQQSLLSPHDGPINHFLITDLSQWNKEKIDFLRIKGFKRIKIKLGYSLNSEITDLLNLFSSTSLNLCFDFNEKLSYNTFKSFILAIDSLKPLIDYIEDPFPYDPILWTAAQKELQIPLACDRQALFASHYPNSFSKLIIKPAILPLELFDHIPHQNLIITSYLDHPLGQLSAAYMAAKIDPKQQNIHGLLSHHAYKPNIFSLQLSDNHPQFTCPKGSGFGFEKELSQLPWTVC